MPEFARPGSITVGDVRISYLADGGGVADPVASFPASSPEEWEHHQRHLDDEGRYVSSIGGFLIESGDRRLVVDLGIGPVSLEFPGVGVYTGGSFLDSLAIAGSTPEDVTDLVYTHMHLDHCGWTSVADGAGRRLTFPNARHLATADEWDHWRGGDSPVGPNPETVQPFLDGRLEEVGDGDELVPGVTALATPGHTPGHLSLVVSSAGERAVILGDVMFCPVQMTETDWAIAFDADPAGARATRERMLDELERTGAVGAGCHLTAGLVFGRVLRTDEGRVWQGLA